MAKITITLEDGEQQALVQLLDLACKQGGLGAARAAAHIVMKLEAAQAETVEHSGLAIIGNGETAA